MENYIKEETMLDHKHFINLPTGHELTPEVKVFLKENKR